jgi:hypothetical protein
MLNTQDAEYYLMPRSFCEQLSYKETIKCDPNSVPCASSIYLKAGEDPQTSFISLGSAVLEGVFCAHTSVQEPERRV